MKLLIITDGIYPFVIGGMQKHSYYLAKHLAEMGHQITLVHCVDALRKLPTNEEIFEAFGVSAIKNMEVVTLRFPAPSWYPGHYLKESFIYSKIIYDKIKGQLRSFDFIYAKGYSAWYFLDKKSKGEKMPPIGIKFHGYEMFQDPANFKSRIHNWMLKGPTTWNNQHADYIFSYGGKISDIIRHIGVSQEKIIEIPTGIEESWCLQNPIKTVGKSIRFVFVGRFERRKGVEELTAALRELINEHDFSFEFVGPIPPSAKIKSEKITYHGSVSNKIEMQKILDSCQVLVVPSHSEGMPNVIMEGMARGLAILTTNVGAIESVVNSRNGWFVEPGDKESLQKKILEILLLQRSVIREKQEQSLIMIKSFLWERIASETADRISERLG